MMSTSVTGGKMLHKVLFVLFIPLTFCLNLLELRVPELMDVREEAVLGCLYELGGDRLYSLKWYKEELEFFRYMPDNTPQMQTFPVDGVNVAGIGFLKPRWAFPLFPDSDALRVKHIHSSGAETKSNVTVITLSPLEYGSSGTYRCEVSTERPHFKTAYRSANMTVLALPRNEPRIDGVKETYLLGDYVEGNCTSSPSNPLADIQWLINDKKVKDWFLEWYKPVKSKDPLQLEYRSLGLRFQIDMSHYQERSQVLTLTCQQTLAGKVRSRATTIHLSRLMTNQKFAQEKLNRGGSTPAAIKIIALAVTLLLLL